MPLLSLALDYLLWADRTELSVTMWVMLLDFALRDCTIRGMLFYLYVWYVYELLQISCLLVVLSYQLKCKYQSIALTYRGTERISGFNTNWSKSSRSRKKRVTSFNPLQMCCQFCSGAELPNNPVVKLCLKIRVWMSSSINWDVKTSDFHTLKES